MILVRAWWLVCINIKLTLDVPEAVFFTAVVQVAALLQASFERPALWFAAAFIRFTEIVAVSYELE